jgi:hypothetical protein
MKIFDGNDRNKLLFEMVDGRLMSATRGNGDLFLSFCSIDRGSHIDHAFSRFLGLSTERDRGNTLDDSARSLFVYRDRYGQIVEVLFPLLRCENGEEVCFIYKQEEKKWRLKTDENWEACEVDPVTAHCTTPAGLPDAESLFRGNPLMGFSACLWMYNAKTCTYKCFIPKTTITRSTAKISHDISASVRIPERGCRLGSNVVAEVVAREDVFAFDAFSIFPTSPLSLLRLAKIYQCQSHYGAAIAQLERFSIHGKMTDDEFYELQEIAMWFFSGNESSAHTAAVSAMAFLNLLKFAPTDSRVVSFIDKISSKYKQWGSFVGALLEGVDVYTLPPRIELFLWKCLSVTLAAGRPRYGDIKIRISHLKQLLHDKALRYRTGFESLETEYLHQITSAEQPFGTLAEEVSINESKYDSAEIGIRSTVANDADLSIIFHESPVDAAGDEDSATAARCSAEHLSQSEKNKIGAQLTALVDEFNEEMRLGEMQLRQRSKDIALTARVVEGNITFAEGKTIRCDMHIARLHNEISAKILVTTEKAKISALNMQRIANANFFAHSLGATPWKMLRIPEVLRWVYGVHIGGREGKALEYMKSRNPGFSKDSLNALIAETEAYLLAVIEMRKLREIKSALDGVIDDRQSDAMRSNFWRKSVLLLRTLRSHQVEDQFDKMSLLFEYMTRIRPRDDQMLKIQFAINSCANGSGGGLIQQLMGSGKTKVLIPFFIMVIHLKGEQLPVIVSHASQLASVFKELPEIFRVIDIRLELFDMEFSDLGNNKALKILYGRLKDAKDSGCCVPVIESTVALALRAYKFSLREQSNADLKSVAIAKKINGFLSNHCVAILDEYHLTADPRFSFIIQKPTLALDMAKLAPDDVSFVVYTIHSLPSALIEAIRRNMHDRLDPKDVTDAFRAHLVRYAKIFKIPEEQKETFFAFMLGLTEEGNHEYEYVDQVEERLMQLPDMSKRKATLLRFLFIKILPSCLKRKYLDNFGYNSVGEVVPYYNRKCTKNHFQNIWEYIVYLNMCILIVGVSNFAIKQWIEILARMAKAQTNSLRPFSQTIPAIYFRKFTATDEREMILAESVDHELKAKPQVVDWIVQLLNDPKHAFMKAQIANELSLMQTSYTQDSFSGTPLQIASMFKRAIGLTGTTFNRASYCNVLRITTSLQAGALGQVAVKLEQDLSQGKSMFHAVQLKELVNEHDGIITAEKILESWFSKTSDNERRQHLRMIVDAGSFLVNQPTREIIHDIAKSLENHQMTGEDGVTLIIFTENDTFVCAHIAEVLRSPTGFAASRYVTQANHDERKVFYYIDAARAVGTDPKIHRLAVSILTVEPTSIGLDFTLQAIMRSREFLDVDSQTVDLISIKESAAVCKITCADDKTVDVRKFLERIMRNTAESIVAQRLHAGAIFTHERIKDFLDKIRDSLEENSTEFPDAVRKQCLKRLERQDARSYFTNKADFQVVHWLRHRMWQNAAEALLCSAEGQFEQIEALGFTQNGLLAMFYREFNACKTSTLDEIKQFTAGIQILAHEFASEASRAQECLQQMEQQTHVEQTMEVQCEVQQTVQAERELQVLQEFCKGTTSVDIRDSDTLCVDGDNAWQCAKAWIGGRCVHPIHKCLPTSKETETPSVVSFCKFSKKFFSHSIFQNFLLTKNFLSIYKDNNTETIFSCGRMEVTNILIVWNPNNVSEFVCIFLANSDCAHLKLKIHRSKFSNCWLCNSHGNAVANNSIAELPEYFTKKQNNSSIWHEIQWVIHFMNANVSQLTRMESLTLSMLKKLQMPNDVAERRGWLESVHQIMLLRSQDSSKTHREILSSYALCNGEAQNVKYAEGLADMKFSLNTSPESIARSLELNENINSKVLIQFAINFTAIALQSEDLKEKIIVTIKDSSQSEELHDLVFEFINTLDDEALLQLYTNSEHNDVNRECLTAALMCSTQRIGKMTSITLFENIDNKPEVFMHITSPGLIAQIWGNRESLGLSEINFTDEQILIPGIDALANMRDCIPKFVAERVRMIHSFELAILLDQSQYQYIDKRYLCSLSDEQLLKFEPDIVTYLSPERINEITNAELAIRCVNNAQNEFILNPNALGALDDNGIRQYFSRENQFLARVIAASIRLDIIMRIPAEIPAEIIPKCDFGSFSYKQIARLCLAQQFANSLPDEILLEADEQALMYLSKERTQQITDETLLARLTPNLWKYLSGQQVQKIRDGYMLNEFLKKYPDFSDQITEEQQEILLNFRKKISVTRKFILASVTCGVIALALFALGVLALTGTLPLVLAVILCYCCLFGSGAMVMPTIFFSQRAIAVWQ